MPEPITSILWRCLHAPGHDACRLLRVGAGWRLEGAALFDQDGRPCCLTYAVDCSAAWLTQTARVTGWYADVAVDLTIERTGAGGWRLNGAEQPAPAGCLDIDLGFTPATNLIAIRRLDLVVAFESEAPAAYLNLPDRHLDRLDQTYRRIGDALYAYAAPAYDYAADLTVTPDGFVTDYPGLWTMQSLSFA